MVKIVLLVVVFILGGSVQALAQNGFEVDTISTSAGDLDITFLGHGTLMFSFNGKVMHIDPFSRVADYATLPKADLILITHDHGDHLDAAALDHIRTNATTVLMAESCAGKVQDGIVIKNGGVQAFEGIRIEALPAYNIAHTRDNGQPFHPKGAGNGYILTFGDTRVYVAGDTENTSEMKALKNIAVAFLPMNLPYTMTPDMVADAAKAFRPGILYPYHFGETDTSQLIELLKDEPGIEVRIRKMS